MLIDNVVITVKAGNGGDGVVTFLSNPHQTKGGPDGGNGGNGGSVFFQGSHNLNDLRDFQFKKNISAESGVHGKRQNKFGRNGEDITVSVPIGTIITDTTSGKIHEITDTTSRILIAKGGLGGRGNNEFKSATNQTPYYAEKGIPGEEKELRLELKLIADIGLVGQPNAGKSSLLSVLTNADPKIGNYPFTTLEPNIGMLGKYAIADIPGLIEGASKGKGLGITFLKHIEKTKMLIHCIDSTTENIESTYQTIRDEFGSYNTMLLEKPEIILLTKTDLIDDKKRKEITNIFAKKSKHVLSYSIYNPESIQKLKQTVFKVLEK